MEHKHGQRGGKAMVGRGARQGWCEHRSLMCFVHLLAPRRQSHTDSSMRTVALIDTQSNPEDSLPRRREHKQKKKETNGYNMLCANGLANLFQSVHGCCFREYTCLDPSPSHAHPIKFNSIAKSSAFQPN